MKKNKLKKKLALGLSLLLVLVSVVSCSGNDDFDVSVTSDIDFMVVEVYDNSQTSQISSLKLNLSTTEIFPCINYRLITTEVINYNELIIEFDKILKSTICLTAVGPAVSSVNLPENINEITFINRGIIDKYSVEINQEKVSITPIEKNFTNSLHDETFRIPENSFALVCGTNTDNQNIYFDFLSIIEQNLNFKELNFIGNGRIPYPEKSDGHWVDHPSKFFTYTDYKDFENLESILNDYSKENIEENSGVSINIYGWNNINFHSWLND